MALVSDTIAAVLPLPGRDRREEVAQPSDRTLIAAARRGEEVALERLFRRHWGAAYRVALLITRDHAAAEDVAQEAFVAAVGRLDRFDRRRPFAPWLARIAANRAIDWARARGVRREVDATAAPEPAAQGSERPREPACSEELLAAFAALTPEQRAVVVLRHLLDYSPGEIAAALELPRGTVNSRLRRGLDALARELREEMG
ncbi:RNA polymerase sigma factor [Conexibacter arvalis]|uniref:RNA polymerase sigma-70 factor (ECF subfamily) n=1 Tax=Conexibacter arvalis TaxID=912552 RepID=A0A840IJW7_9ACTN|nr:sigma-70 family RNA polymerase sigma factor [Conexibacter arvalis]MBB4665019.1 RNA polymerase sigma-70 factor (ECF subfamily) [Conexibacter arvalis]